MIIVKTIESKYGYNTEGKVVLKYELFQLEEQNDEGDVIMLLPGITSDYKKALEKAKELNRLRRNMPM